MKKTKWIFILPILLFAMSVAILSFHAPVWADEGGGTSTYFGGSGDEADPYRISSVADLIELSSYVGKGVQFSGIWFKLTKDLDLSGETSFSPIGSVGKPFKGNFDGAGYSISNVVANASTLTLGLFGATDGATIKNLGVKNIQIQVNSVYVETEELLMYVGGIVGCAKGTTIEECFVKNDQGFEISTTKNAYVGGICGMMSSSSVSNCSSCVNIDVTTNPVAQIGLEVGGVVGRCYESQIDNSYSEGNIACGNQTASIDVQFREGGVCGFVQGTNSRVKNVFCVGNVGVKEELDSTGVVRGTIVGGIVGNSSLTPNAGNLNFCHYLQTSQNNYGLTAIGSNLTYDTEGMTLKSHKDLAYFKEQSNYNVTDSFDQVNKFDFDSVWLIDEGLPTLQLFAYYDIQIEQIENLTMSVVGGEEISENTYKFKAGQTVVINATIDEDVEKFYHIQTWRRDQGDIKSTAGLEHYEFVCSYLTQGTYSVVLKENTFSLTLKITPASFEDSSSSIDYSSIASIKYESAGVGNGFTGRSILYGREVSIEAVLGTSENAQNYAFAGWYVGGDAATKLDWDSSVLTFKIGDNVVPFDEDLNIVLTPKFTRDICRLTVQFDASMGKVRLYENEEFSGDAVANKPIKKGSTLNLEAECLEGYEFLGWFREGDLDPLSKNLKLSGYEIKDDTQNLVAKFKSIDTEEEVKKGLSGWAIFGIVAGCLAVVGAVVLTVVLVKKKSSYKSNWNF